MVMERETYVDKMLDFLHNSETYEIVSHYPTNKMICDLHDLSSWKSKSYINIYTYNSLNCTNRVLSRAYGLSKIHKPNCSLRVIVSYVYSPLLVFSLFLHKLIYKSIPPTEIKIHNSFHLVSNYLSMTIDEHYELFSLNAVSLFTNVPVDLAILGITNQWESIGNSTAIPRDEFINPISFVLESTYFTFNNTIFKQTFGSLMGSPLSPVIADVVLQDVEL